MTRACECRRPERRSISHICHGGHPCLQCRRGCRRRRQGVAHAQQAGPADRRRVRCGPKRARAHTPQTAPQANADVGSACLAGFCCEAAAFRIYAVVPERGPRGPDVPVSVLLIAGIAAAATCSLVILTTMYCRYRRTHLLLQEVGTATDDDHQARGRPRNRSFVSLRARRAHGRAFSWACRVRSAPAARLWQCRQPSCHSRGRRASRPRGLCTPAKMRLPAAPPFVERACTRASPVA
jgi:hypothetical protein